MRIGCSQPVVIRLGLLDYPLFREGKSMYKGERVIDVHGHMSTPPHFRAFAYNMIALRSTDGSPNISDQLMETALGRQGPPHPTSY